MVQSLTRTVRIRSPQPPSFSAATMFLRASGLASGATASSMSRKTWSVGSPLALSIILVLDPGTARLERRDRSGRAAGCVVMAPEATDAGRARHRPPR